MVGDESGARVGKKRREGFEEFKGFKGFKEFAPMWEQILYRWTSTRRQRTRLEPTTSHPRSTD